MQRLDLKLGRKIKRSTRVRMSHTFRTTHYNNVTLPYVKFIDHNSRDSKLRAKSHHNSAAIVGQTDGVESP